MESKSFIIGLVIGLIILSIPSFVIYVKLSDTSNELSQSEQKLSNCQQDKSNLEINLTQLKQDYQQLMNNYEILKSSYQGLQDKYNNLNVNYTNTLDLYNKLNQNYNNLLDNYTKLEKDYSLLESNYNDLKNNYNILQQDLSRLEQNYQALNESYYSILNEYNNLVDVTLQTDNWLNMYSGKYNESIFYNQLLNKAVESAKPITDLALFTGTPGYRAFNVFYYTLIWLNYCPDNYVRYVDLDNDKINIENDVIMLPNETWSNGCGDCEDLALFDYGILNLTASNSESIYLVEFNAKGSSSGHAALILVWHINNTKRYYVIDPAGNYFNGLSMYLKIDIKATNGTEYWYWLDPLNLGNYTKEYMLDNDLAVVEYYDYSEGKYYSLEETPIYYYTDIQTALHDWLISYWGAYPIEYIIIAGPSVYREFNSLTDAGNWLNNYG